MTGGLLGQTELTTEFRDVEAFEMERVIDILCSCFTRLELEIELPFFFSISTRSALGWRRLCCMYALRLPLLSPLRWTVTLVYGVPLGVV